LDELFHLGVRLGAQWFALVERERVRKVVTTLLDDPRDPLHRRRAVERGAARPLARGRVRRRDRPLGGVARSLRDGPDGLAGGRARRLDAAAGIALDPRPRDVHRVVDRRPRGHRPPLEKALRWIASYPPPSTS